MPYQAAKERAYLTTEADFSYVSPTLLPIPLVAFGLLISGFVT